jgi:hypothetical protein
MIADFSREYSLFAMAGGELRCQVNIGRVTANFQEARAPAVLSLGRWSAVACVADAGRLSLRVDGREVASQPLTDPVAGRYYSEALNIGRNHVTSGQPNLDQFLGAIDNVRIWRRARPVDER